jgi:hypothetical protein
MTAGIVLTVLITIAALIWIVAPLLRADAAESERVSSAVSEERDLRSKREMALTSLRDLEDDRATGKIDDKDYAELKASLSAQAIDIMKQLDALEEARARSAPVAVPKPKVDTPGSTA